MGDSRRKRRQAITPEGKEAQLVSLAYDVAERQMLEDRAPAQVVAHFLKLGSSREKLEQARIEQDNLLLSAKIKQMESQQKLEETYTKALEAMRSYMGVNNDEDEDRYYEE